jgi:hypothetical protein
MIIRATSADQRGYLLLGHRGTDDENLSQVLANLREVGLRTDGGRLPAPAASAATAFYVGA